MLQEVTDYLDKLQDYKDVYKSGKDYYSGSLIDIGIRFNRMEEAKHKAIEALGKIELQKIENTLNLRK